MSKAKLLPVKKDDPIYLNDFRSLVEMLDAKKVASIGERLRSNFVWNERNAQIHDPNRKEACLSQIGYKAHDEAGNYFIHLVAKSTLAKDALQYIIDNCIKTVFFDTYQFNRSLLNLKSPFNELRPLQSAILSGKIQNVELLLELGADPEKLGGVDGIRKWVQNFNIKSFANRIPVEMVDYINSDNFAQYIAQNQHHVCKQDNCTELKDAEHQKKEVAKENKRIERQEQRKAKQVEDHIPQKGSIESMFAKQKPKQKVDALVGAVSASAPVAAASHIPPKGSIESMFAKQNAKQKVDALVGAVSVSAPAAAASHIPKQKDSIASMFAQQKAKQQPAAVVHQAGAKIEVSKSVQPEPAARLEPQALGDITNSPSRKAPAAKRKEHASPSRASIGHWQSLVSSRDERRSPVKHRLKIDNFFDLTQEENASAISSRSVDSLSRSISPEQFAKSAKEFSLSDPKDYYRQLEAMRNLEQGREGIFKRS